MWCLWCGLRCVSLWLLLWLWSWSWCVCVRCGPVCRFKTPPFVHSKRPRECRQHAHMLFNMCVCCRYTRRRFECTHGGVLNGHTGSHHQFCLPRKSPRRVLTWSQRFTKETLGSYPFLSLRIGREQHVSDSSNHSLYLMKLLSSSYPEGNVGGNQL